MKKAKNSPVASILLGVLIVVAGALFFKDYPRVVAVGLVALLFGLSEGERPRLFVWIAAAVTAVYGIVVALDGVSSVALAASIVVMFLYVISGRNIAVRVLSHDIIAPCAATLMLAMGCIYGENPYAMLIACIEVVVYSFYAVYATMRKVYWDSRLQLVSKLPTLVLLGGATGVALFAGIAAGELAYFAIGIPCFIAGTVNVVRFIVMMARSEGWRRAQFSAPKAKEAA